MFLHLSKEPGRTLAASISDIVKRAFWSRLVYTVCVCFPERNLSLVVCLTFESLGFELETEPLDLCEKAWNRTPDRAWYWHTQTQIIRQSVRVFLNWSWPHITHNKSLVHESYNMKPHLGGKKWTGNTSTTFDGYTVFIWVGIVRTYMYNSQY